MKPASLAFVFALSMALGSASGGVQGAPPIKIDAAQSGAQSVQYKSPAGVEYRSLPDTEAVTKAQAALAADPRNVAKIIELGVAQSGARQFREAIATFTRGLEIEPNNALLLRWRGHRYLSVREFDKARADLTRGSTIDPSIYGIWYHLGIIQYVGGDFAAAAASFAKAQPIAPDPGELAGSTDWLWMSLNRAGRGAEAKAMLDRKPESRLPPIDNAYTRRLQLYRGEIGPEKVITPADTDEVQIATLAYGLGNWYLVKGDKAKARESFERSVKSGGWPGFGFILSEVELRRLQPSAAQSANTLSPAETAAGWRLLFDGATSAGWHLFGGGRVVGWEVADGALIALAQDGGHDIVTDDEFENVELVLDWKLSPRANSGVFFNVVEQGYKVIYATGPEYQIIDDDGWPTRLEDWQHTGANYAMHPPLARAAKPVGEWNRTRIVVDRGHVELWLNSTKTADYVMWTDEWAKLVSTGKWKDYPGYGRARKGRIGLQDHGNKVWFRNIKVRAIPSPG